MNRFYYSLIVSALCGIGGTAFGSIIAIFIVSTLKQKKGNHNINTLIQKIIGFAGGIMLSIICFDLIPSSLDYDDIGLSILIIMAGCLFTGISELIINTTSCSDRNKKNASSLYGMGILVLIGITLHNLPEGLALGAGLSSPSSISISLAIIIMLHNIPEGLALAIPFLAMKKSKVKVIFISILAGAPTLLGALIGHILVDISEDFISLSLGFAGGAMLYIVVGEIFPVSYQGYYKDIGIMTVLVGFFIGMIITITL